MTRIMFATPALGGNLTCKFTESLIQTLFLLKDKQINSRVFLKKSSSLLIAERNSVLSAFMKSDCSHLMCIDSDMGWSGEDVLKLLNHDEPIVGACYLTRDKKYIVRLKEDVPLLNDKGLFEADAIPMGFCMLRRDAIQEMQDYFPDLYYRSGEYEAYGLFNTMVRDQEFWGEDFSFFLRAGDAGLKVWVDPSIELIHATEKGKIEDALNLRKE